MYLIADGGIVSCNTSNTVDAIMLSKNISYIDGVKLDVRMTKDGVLVLSRSNDLSKITLSKKKVSEENYEYIKKVKFPSHIFKYYIPTLNEILKRYSNQKIIILELYNCKNYNKYLNNLFDLLKKYSYKYYFIIEDNELLKVIKNSDLLEIGEILEYDNYEKVNDYHDLSPRKKDLFIISMYPEKIYKYLTYYDNNSLF